MNDKQPTDQQLQRLYRAHATQEPSSAADRRILDAARRGQADGHVARLLRRVADQDRKSVV